MTKQIIAALLTAIPYAVTSQVVIDIDADRRGPMISPTHYGIFMRTSTMPLTEGCMRS